MSKLAAILALPDEATVPAGFVREAVQEQREERIRLAAIREETLHMWGQMATEHLCMDGEWESSKDSESSEATSRRRASETAGRGRTQPATRE